MFNRASLPVLKSGSGDLSAPQINLLGKKFGLINAKIGFHVPFFDKVEIGHDLNEKKSLKLYSAEVSEKKKEDDPYWKSDYKKIQKFGSGFLIKIPRQRIFTIISEACARMQSNQNRKKERCCFLLT